MYHTIPLCMILYHVYSLHANQPIHMSTKPRPVCVSPDTIRGRVFQIHPRPTNNHSLYRFYADGWSVRKWSDSPSAKERDLRDWPDVNDISTFSTLSPEAQLYKKNCLSIQIDIVLTNTHHASASGCNTIWTCCKMSAGNCIMNVRVTGFRKLSWPSSSILDWKW